MSSDPVREPVKLSTTGPNKSHSEPNTLRLENRTLSANEGYFGTLIKGFQFRRHPDLPRSHAVLDLILVMMSFASMHVVYLGHLNLTGPRSFALLSVLAVLPLTMYLGSMYSTRKLQSLGKELTKLWYCWTITFGAIGLIAFLSKTAVDISRLWITSSMLLALLALSLVRVLLSLSYRSEAHGTGRNVVVVGDASGVNSVISNLIETSNPEVQLARVFDISDYTGSMPDSNGVTENAGSTGNSGKQLSSFIEKQRQSGAAIEQVWIAVSENQSRIVEDISSALADSSVDICVVPDQYARRLINGDLTSYGDVDIVNVSEISLAPGAAQFKRFCDVILSVAALLVLGIPMFLIAAAIRLDSKGPILFRQKRYGEDGREIEILKFRSMYVHASNDETQARKDDHRVTRIGKIIRRSSLDELPQLINVLNGDMSLIGPRPHAVSHNELWRQEIQGYMMRHKVKPGITGWAQVNGWRGETDTAFKMQQRVKHDLEYIQNWSPWLDFKILFLTAFVGFFHKNAY